MILRSVDKPTKKPFYEEISGTDKAARYYPKRQAKLFATIVNNAASTSYKKNEVSLVAQAFISFKNRGKLVAIGPLEYCGSGIPLQKSGKGNTDKVL